MGDLNHALAALERRSSAELARFILSLAYTSNGIATYVQTFIAAENPAIASALLKQELHTLIAGEREYDYRHRQSFEFSARADRFFHAVAMWLLPRDPKLAAELLERFIASGDEIVGHCYEDDSAGDLLERAQKMRNTLK